MKKIIQKIRLLIIEKILKMTNLKARGNGFIIFSDVSGEKGTIPTVENHTDEGWLPTDLYVGETLINSVDEKAYINVGGKIYEQHIMLSSTFDIEDISPYNFPENTTGNVITINGIGLTGTSLEMESEFVENVVYEIISDMEARITFDTLLIEKSYDVTSFLEKDGYKHLFGLVIIKPETNPLAITGHSPDTITNSPSENISLELNKEITNLDDVEVQSDSGNISVVSFGYEDGLVNVELDASAMTQSEIFYISVTADEESTGDWDYSIKVIVE